jgi:hypothetical protein
VMTRIGMVHDEGGDFAHPKIAADHPMSKHVLYRLRPPIRSATGPDGHPPQSAAPLAETPTR